MYACQKTTSKPQPISEALKVKAPKNITAGTTAKILVEKKSSIPKLISRSVLGTSIVKPSLYKKNILLYEIDTSITKRSGILEWTLVNGKYTKSGKIKIAPYVEAANLEVYIGPTTMNAGSRQSAMTAIVPTDKYDNILNDGHTAIIKTSINGKEIQKSLSTKDGVMHMYHDAPNKKGNVYSSITDDPVSSEEYTYQINAGPPAQIEISADPQHSYADGSTPLTIITNVIKDAYGNIVENGTLITFSIVDSDNQISKAYAYTIDGIAKGLFLHPSFSTRWNINATAGNRTSNQIKINFETVIETLPLEVSEAGTIKIGPIESYMGQLIPDGLPIIIEIEKHDNKIYRNTFFSQKGIVELDIHQVITSPLDSSLKVRVKSAGLSNSLRIE